MSEPETGRENENLAPRPSPWSGEHPERLTGLQAGVASDRIPARNEPAINIASVVIFFLAMMAAIHAVREWLLPPFLDNQLLYWFAFIPELVAYGPSAVAHEAMAAVTYSLLHGGWTHFFLNAVWLTIFGSPLARRIGAGRFVLFWVVTAFGAAAFHFATDPFGQGILVGASGAISGMMGAAARLGFRVDRKGRRRAFSGPPLRFREVVRSRPVMGFVLIWLLVNLMTGLFITVGESAIAWQAHIGGFIAGFLLLPLFTSTLRKQT